MRSLVRLAWLALLLVSVAASAQTVASPQRPFGQLIDLWARQLDRIATRTEQADLLPTEIDTLRQQTADVRDAAMAAAALARSDFADTKKLLAPLEVKPGTDAAPETDAVKAERERLTEQATVAESRSKQCEVVIARADQLLERMTKLRGELILQTLLRRDPSPLSPGVWAKVGPQLADSLRALSTSAAAFALIAATVVCTNATKSPTVKIFSEAASGTSMPKASSIDMMSSTWSRLVACRSSTKRAPSGAPWAPGPRRAATTCRVRVAMSFMARSFRFLRPAAPAPVDPVSIPVSRSPVDRFFILGRCGSDRPLPRPPGLRRGAAHALRRRWRPGPAFASPDCRRLSASA